MGDPCRERLLHGVCGAAERILVILAPCGKLRQSGASYEQRVVIVGLQYYWVHDESSTQDLIKPKILLDLGHKTGTEILAAAVHRQL